MEQAIKKAIEGEWNKGYHLQHYGVMGEILLVNGMRSKALIEAEVREDPLFWQALGKALGWKNIRWIKMYGDFRPDYQTKRYHYEWHRFIDWLYEGKDADSFFKELINKEV